MSRATKILIVLAILGAAGGYYAYSRGSMKANEAAQGAGEGKGGGAEGKGGAAPGGGGKPGDPKAPTVVPVAISHVRERSIPIYLEGLGTVQAFQGVTVRSQIEGVIEKIDFVEGQDVKAGQRLALVDARTYQAQLDQAIAKKLQDEAKTQQDHAKMIQDQTRIVQDQALEKQAGAKKLQDQALGKQAQAKKKQDETNLANGRVNLKRYEDSKKENAVSEQVVTDQRSNVSQLELQVQSDESAIQAIDATVQGDEVAIQAVHASIAGDEAAVQADLAAINGDEAAVKADEGSIAYAQVFVSYATIKSPIDGRTGVRLVDAGNLVRTTDTTGIVVVTQLQPISVVFTLPQQNLQAINKRRATTKMSVLAVDGDKNTIDTGELLLVDNQIDTTTGTIKLKATFPNAKLQLWPGGFVNIRLLLETRENAMVVSAPAVQQGPNGTYVFLVKADSTVEMKPVKVALIQDGKAILEQGLAKDDEVVLSGHDRLKSGSKVSVDRSKTDKAKAARIKADEAENATKHVDETNHPVDEGPSDKVPSDKVPADKDAAMKGDGNDAPRAPK